MKLNIITPENIGTFRRGESKIGVSRKSGLISISSDASNAIGLGDSSKIIFCQDDARLKDWYIKKVSDEIGFKVRKKDKGTGCCVNSTGVVERILKSLSLTEKSYAFMLSSEPVVDAGSKYFAIITSKPILR